VTASRAEFHSARPLPRHSPKDYDYRGDRRRGVREFLPHTDTVLTTMRLNPKPLSVPHSPPAVSAKHRDVTTLLAVCALLAVPAVPFVTSAAAQTAPSTPPASDKPDANQGEVVRLEQFVISGTVAPKRSMDSPASITTIDASQIRLSAPIGAPDLVKQVPGFYVEAGGGEARANVRTRGLPSSGGYFYVGLQQDGLPILEDGGTFPDQYVRATSFVVRTEAIRGGASGVFQNNAPGGILNFISREGAAVHQGEVFFQTTSYDQLKGEFWDSGPINSSTTYAAYAGYSRDKSPKKTDFYANSGGSVMANLKHTFDGDRGYVKFSGQWMNQANVLIIQIPLKGANPPAQIPGGPDLKNGSLFSDDLRHPVVLPNTPRGSINPDVQNDGGIRQAVATADLSLTLSPGWKLRAISRFADVVSIGATPVVTSPATPFQTLANSIAAGAGAQFAAARNATTGLYSYRLSMPGLGGQAVNDPASLNGNGLGVLQSVGVSKTRLDNLQNDVRLTRTIAGNGAISGGAYLSYLDSTSFATGHTIVNDVSPHAHRVDFQYFDAAGNSLGFGTFNGIRQASAAASFRHRDSSGINFAPYLNLEVPVGNWDFEAGVRRENKYQTVNTETAAVTNLNQPGQNIPALRNAAFGSGNWIDTQYSRAATVWTAAANYKFNNHLSAYVRMMNGYRLPLSGDFGEANYARTFNPGPTERITQVETGVKYDSRRLSVYASAIHSTLNNQLFIGNFAQPDGSLVTTSYIRSTNADSLELETFYSPIKPLTFHVVATVQKVLYSKDIFVSGTSSGKLVTVNLNGRRAFQVPKVYSTGGVIYKFGESRLGKLSTNVDWEYIGQRSGDDANFLSLPSFTQFNAGVRLASGPVTYTVGVKNVFDRLGYTAYDPRINRVIGDPTVAYSNARTYFPRSYLASVSYSY